MSVTQLQPYLRACCGKHLSQEAEGGPCSLCNEVTASDRHFQLFSKAMYKVSRAYADKCVEALEVHYSDTHTYQIRHPPLLMMVLLHQQLQQVLQGI